MVPTQPSVARVTSLSHWLHFFHPEDGIFRFPALVGHGVQHLDIDLRFIQPVPRTSSLAPIHLPMLTRVTLRADDLAQEDDERMQSLADVLGAIRPVEVHWIHGNGDEPPTMSTHFVHPSIIRAGLTWGNLGNMRKLVVKGGFPCRATVPGGGRGARFTFAFAPWRLQELWWELDNCSQQCCLAIVHHYVRAAEAVGTTATHGLSLPAMVILISVPPACMAQIVDLPHSLTLEDRTFVTHATRTARLWNYEHPDGERSLTRLKADLLVGQASQMSLLKPTMENPDALVSMFRMINLVDTDTDGSSTEA